jgi:hypothetical protein
VSKTIEISVRVHKTLPVCCRSALLSFAAGDRYRGSGEPGDRVRCPLCGNWLRYEPPGWRVDE